MPEIRQAQRKVHKETDRNHGRQTGTKEDRQTNNLYRQICIHLDSKKRQTDMYKTFSRLIYIEFYTNKQEKDRHIRRYVQQTAK